MAIESDFKFLGNTTDKLKVRATLEELQDNMSPTESSENTTENRSVSVPAGYVINQIIIQNTTANLVTINIGTTDGGSDVVSGLIVAISSLGALLDSLILKRVFNLAASQTLYITSLNWNSASLNVYIKLEKLIY